VLVRTEPATGPADVDPSRPWCWEGIVVRAVSSFLTARGWSIEAIANTETGEPGVDIKARRADSVLIVDTKLLTRVTLSLKLLGLLVLLVQESGTVMIVQDEKQAV
jgi:hypothetical protein